MAESERLRGSRSPVTNYKVGDGSVGDLFKYIVGGDLPVKRINGKRKATTIRNKTEKEVIRKNIGRTFTRTSAMSASGAVVEQDYYQKDYYPGHVEVRDLPPVGMELYRTGMPNKEMGIRGTTGIPPRPNRYGVSVPEVKRTAPLVDPVYGSVVPEEDEVELNIIPAVEKDDRNFIGEFGKGFGNIGQQESNSPPSIAKKVIDAIYNFGGLLNAPSTKDIVMAIGPENISAEENAEIDEVKYYLDRYPEIMALARKLKRPPTDQEIIAIIQEYEKGGRLKSDKTPYLMKAYGGRVRPKKKRKKRLSKGGKVTSYNY